GDLRIRRGREGVLVELVVLRDKGQHSAVSVAATLAGDRGDVDAAAVTAIAIAVVVIVAAGADQQEARDEYDEKGRQGSPSAHAHLRRENPSTRNGCTSIVSKKLVTRRRGAVTVRYQ